jgi:hypothetical protein
VEIFADKLISNGQSSESLNSLNDHGQNVTRVLAGTPIRKVRKNERKVRKNKIKIKRKSSQIMSKFLKFLELT